MRGKTIHELLDEYRSNKGPVLDIGKLYFNGIDGLDVYNPTSPFSDKDAEALIARVEPRDTEYSHIRFFYKENNTCKQIPNSPVLPLQDPFWTVIQGELVVGGVEIIPDAWGHIIAWRTKLYRGASLLRLHHFFDGPLGMKDLRLCETTRRDIAVFTRPQGAKGGRGKIGFIRIASLNDLSMSIIDQAPLLDIFNDDEWGGVNQPILLDDGSIGCLGHIACFSEGNVRHYYPMTFVFNPDTSSHTYPKIILERSDILPGPTKRDDLQDVLFPGGLSFVNGSWALLYLGVSDAECQVCKIRNPFMK